jgi:hypothetical protein
MIKLSVLRRDSLLRKTNVSPRAVIIDVFQIDKDMFYH